MRFARIYGDGAAMGFSPDQIGRMSLFQFLAARAGWIRANSTEDEAKDLTPTEFEELGAWLDEPPVWH